MSSNSVGLSTNHTGDSISRVTNNTTNSTEKLTDRVSGNLIRKTKKFKTIETATGLSSVESKLLGISPNGKKQFLKLFNYLNIALRSRYSGCEKDKKIRYFDYNHKQGNFPITLAGVRLALKKIINTITDEEVNAILNACTHTNTSIDSVDSYTNTGKKFLEKTKMDINYLELKHIKKVLDSNLKIKFKDNKFYDILVLCANNNLDNINLEGADLSNLQLEKVSFKKANLKNTNLIGTILKGANLEKTNLEGADFNKASLEEASLKEAILKNADFQHAHCLKSIFDGAIFADKTNSSNNRTSMRYGNFREASFKNAHMNHVDLRNAKLQTAKFERANLLGALFEDAYLCKTSFSNCNMKYSKFNKTTLRSTSFNSSNLSFAHMENIVAKNADFAHVILEGARLIEAVFDKVTLNDIDLRDANLFRAQFKYDIHVKTDAVKIDTVKIHGADFTDATFSNTSFKIWFPSEVPDLAFWFHNGKNSEKLLNTLNSINNKFLNNIKYPLLRDAVSWIQDHANSQNFKFSEIYPLLRDICFDSKISLESLYKIHNYN